MLKTALVPVAEGTEELEAVTIIDVLRRAGIEVTVASANHGDNLHIRGANGTHIVADKMLDHCVEMAYDLIAVPGGDPWCRTSCSPSGVGYSTSPTGASGQAV